MRWLLIGLLVSLGALLYAAAAVARHILVQRRQLRHARAVVVDPVEEPEAEEPDIEQEP